MLCLFLVCLVLVSFRGDLSIRTPTSQDADVTSSGGSGHVFRTLMSRPQEDGKSLTRRSDGPTPPRWQRLMCLSALVLSLFVVYKGHPVYLTVCIYMCFNQSETTALRVWKLFPPFTKSNLSPSGMRTVSLNKNFWIKQTSLLKGRKQWNNRYVQASENQKQLELRKPVRNFINTVTI